MTTTASVAMQPRAPSEDIVYSVADSEGVEPTELNPLYDAIDPDALDSLVAGAGEQSLHLEIEFTYHGYTVTVSADGKVYLDEDV